MPWFITQLITAVISPPLSLLLPFVLGILLFYRRPKAARILLIVACSLLWIASTPYFAESALRLLESRTTLLDMSRPKGPMQAADAIVILGGGTYFHAPEYAGQDTVSGSALNRLRYGAKLQRETGKPILVTGGNPLGNDIPEAQQMRIALERDFRVPVSWTENRSANTLENARFSYRILQGAGIQRIYLVTHAWHMPRAAYAFRRAGFEVVEAPTAFTTRYRTDLLTFLPNAESLRDSNIFIHEMIGLLWYRVKFAISDN
jgi:uncharacterized SAM-binding protein YcdF (DUF218 family)